MRHLRRYIKLIRRAQERGTGVERHHVFPRALFGENDFIVSLTMREHYLAHKLLFHICQHRYGKHPFTYKMALACEMMGNRNSRYYEATRGYFVEHHHTRTSEGRLKNSRAKLGDKNGMFGKPAWNRGRKKPEDEIRRQSTKIAKTYRVDFTNGTNCVITNITQWSKNHGYNSGHLIQIGKGNRKRHKDIIGVTKLD